MAKRKKKQEDRNTKICTEIQSFLDETKNIFHNYLIAAI